MATDRTLDQRVVLITGASHGIGAAVARGAATAGATVIACGRDVGALERLADACVADGLTEPVLLPINLERAGVDDYAQVAGHVESRFGRLDGLVFNAARVGVLSPVDHIDPANWARVMQVNLNSPFLLLQAMLPLLRKAARGASLVFTLAAEGLSPAANWGAYAVSKCALDGLMRLCAAEFADDPRLGVSAVVPPPSRTELRCGVYPGLNPATLAPPEAVVPYFLELLGPRGVAAAGLVLDGRTGKPWARPA
ncbi:MAG: SDR family NAD(P)-dependent oxidoreductase [Gammaproteobacteria bacterium]